MTTRTNLVPNPSFETNTTGWDIPGTRTNAQAFSGSWSMQHVSGIGSPRTLAGTSGIPVEPNATYVASFYVKAGAVDSDPARVNLQWLNSSGGFISAGVGAEHVIGTSWSRVTAVLTAPSNAAYVQFIVWLPVSPDSTMYLDAVMLEKASVVGAYFDGDTPGAQWDGTPHASTSSSAPVSGSVSGGYAFSGSATGKFVATGAVEAGEPQVHSFLADDTFVVDAPVTVDYLIVGGGGGGASGYGGVRGGGGGAGGVLEGSIQLPAGSYEIVVGQGGAANPGNAGGLLSEPGGDSSAFGLTAFGGGGARNWGAGGSSGSGGSGGGGTYSAVLSGSAPGSGTPGQGHDGGAGSNSPNSGGGGGGASAPGQSGPDGGNGGDGYTSTITGLTYGGGGGGGPTGLGGAGGGGAAGEAGVDGEPGTGGGGGGSNGGFAIPGGAGGSGIVLVTVAATGAGYGFAGSAAGQAPEIIAGAAGSWEFSGTAAGESPPDGFASGTWTFTGTVSGKRIPVGNASGAWTYGTVSEGDTPPEPALPLVPNDHAKLEVETGIGVWTNVTGESRTITVDRHDGGPGTLAAEILDANLDPTQTEAVRLGRGVRLSVAGHEGVGWVTVYTGTLDNVEVEYDPLAPPGKGVNVKLSGVDRVAALANQTEPRGVASIDELRWIVTGVPFVINGSSAPGSGTVVARNENASIWDQVLVTRDSNLGYAWVDPLNRLQVWDAAQLDPTVKATLGPDLYRTVDIDFALDQVINSVIVNWRRYNIGTETSVDVPYGPYEDTTSIAQWGVRQVTFTAQGAVEDEADIAAFASDVLARNAVAEIRAKAAVVPVNDTYDLAVVRDLDLNSRVNVVLTDGVTTQSLRVVGIEHAVTTRGWLTTYEFAQPSGVVAPSQTPGTGHSPIPDGSIDEGALDPDLVQTIEQALADAEDALGLAETKVKTYWETTPPAHVGADGTAIWFDTDDGNKIHRWNGTGWVVATASHLITPNGRLVVNTNGLYAVDTGGNPTFTLDAATGNVTMRGSLTSGSTVSGATVTGGQVETTSLFNRGVKMNSSGFVAYDSLGNPTFVITGSTGAITMKGSLLAGSTITGTDITGSSFSTASSGERIVLKKDASAGIMEFWAGASGEVPAKVNASNLVTPQLSLTSGTRSGASNPASVTIRTGSGADSVINLSADQVLMPGVAFVNTLRTNTGNELGIGGLDTYVNMPGTIKQGTRTVTMGAAGVNAQASVTFPNAFPAGGPVPAVVLTPVGITADVTMKVSVTGVSRSGFTINVVRSSGTANVDVNWLAVTA